MEARSGSDVERFVRHTGFVYTLYSISSERLLGLLQHCSNCGKALKLVSYKVDTCKSTI